MKRTSYRRVHVPYFCERCGKVEYEGQAFGREVITHLQASSGDRTMYCRDCDPNPPLRPLAMFGKIEFVVHIQPESEGE